MSAEATAAVQRAAMIGGPSYTGAMIDPREPHVWRRVAVNMLTAALDTECHESVAREWGGDEEPCNAAVVGYRLDEEHPYPVCADHMRDPMVPLTVALLGPTS